MTEEEYKDFDYTKFVDCLRATTPDTLSGESLSGGILHSAVGMSSETGEILGHIKKVIWQGHCINCNYIIKELGDILYYFTSMCNLIGTNIDEVRKQNIEKLTKRYPEGVFDKERSINRNE
ncbi:hypothetical protein LCGC14_0404360 [marine sediment metagenome]|uniref:NTP pyrophosphohydrolase MazG-like domain-containing protein n=1 Tax=marine sediment metagenome TaxID=412755 RepID=A0A0F9TDY4_9ZZZZ